MDSGRGASLRMRAGLAAATIVPLVLLIGAPAHAGHEDHAAERECAVCDLSYQAGALPGSVEAVAARVPAPAAAAHEVRRDASRPPLRRPARAPPA